jgi:hypothetical protein
MFFRPSFHWSFFQIFPWTLFSHIISIFHQREGERPSLPPVLNNGLLTNWKYISPLKRLSLLV